MCFTQKPVTFYPTGGLHKQKSLWTRKINDSPDDMFTKNTVTVYNLLPYPQAPTRDSKAKDAQ